MPDPAVEAAQRAMVNPRDRWPEAYGNAMIAGVEAGATATAEAFGQINKILGGGQ